MLHTERQLEPLNVCASVIPSISLSTIYTGYNNEKCIICSLFTYT